MSQTDSNRPSSEAHSGRRLSLLHVAVIAVAAGMGIAFWLRTPSDRASNAQTVNPMSAVTPPLSVSSTAGATANSGDGATTTIASAVDGGAADVKPETDDEKHRRMLLGQWTQVKDGKRHFTIHEDGTGLMIVEPEAIYAFVVGNRIEIDITWKIENGRAVFDSIRGRPESSFAWVSKVMGTHRDRRIVEMTDDHLLLHDVEADEQSEWVRVKPAK